MNDLLDPLRDADPARDHAPDAAASARMDAMLATLLRDAPAPAKTRTWRLPRPVLAFGTAGALATAALAITFAAPQSASVAPSPASAATVLGQLSAADAATPESTGRYAYRRSIDYTSHMRAVPGSDDKRFYAVVFPHVTEQWLDDGGDGVTRSRADFSKPSFPTPEDRAAYEASTQDNRQLPGADGMRVEDVEIAGLSPAQIRALPTTTPELRAAVLAGMRASGVKTDNAVVEGAAQLLSTPLTPQPVRAALFALLRAEPGAVASDDVRDPLGRGGVAITFTSEAWNTTLLFDRDSGDVLGVRSVGLKELPGRTITDWSVTVESSRTDTAPEAAEVQPPRDVPVPPPAPTPPPGK